MTPEDDRKLAEAFADLRREEEGRIPPFAEVVRRGRARSSRGARFLPARSLWLSAAVALVALGVWLGVWLEIPAREPRPSAAVPPLAEWRSPTDFLLATPGRDLLGPAAWNRSVLDLREAPLASHSERRSPS
jgi:hypothetical protein